VQGYFSLIENARTYDDAYAEEHETYATIYFRIDSKYYIYSRDVYLILEFLGDIGGLQSALFSVGYMFISFITKKLFLSSFMQQMYHTAIEKNEKTD
jgi:hypothetical protein